MRYYDYLTEFIFVEHEPREADYIFIPGSGYGELALKAAALYREDYAKKIVVSGKYSILEKQFAGPVSPEIYCGGQYETECDFLAKVLVDEKVSPEHILLEKQASYTYENAIYTRRLLGDEPVRQAIIVCQAYHARRCLLYYRILFPETELFVIPVVTRSITRDNWYQDPEKIHIVLGEVERCGKQFHDIITADAEGKLYDKIMCF